MIMSAGKIKNNLDRPIMTTIRHEILILIIFLLISLYVPTTAAQSSTPGTPDPYPYAKFSPSMAIIIAVLVTALFFMGFFSIYIRRCSQTSTGGSSVRATRSIRSRRAAANRGLDAAVIDTFPTMAYSEVKGLKIGKETLECAVCLNEFEDDETLRLLPKCDHVFHPECIDMWLGSHTTCPVCRADLVPLSAQSVELPGEEIQQPDPIINETINNNNNIVEDVHQDQEVRLSIIADENVEEVKPEVMKRGGSLRVNRPPRSGSIRSKLFGFGTKFPRSHSTGHSLVQPGENLDRFTLRLPEEIRKEIMKRALNRTGSCAASSLQCEGSARKGNRTGNEESSSRGKNYRRLGSLEHVVKSDRWVLSRMPSFLSRALSVRSTKVAARDGEASTSAGQPNNCEEVSVNSSESAGLAVNDSAKLPV